MTEKASLGKITRCVGCPFSWSMQIAGGAIYYYCGEGKEIPKPLEIPDWCPLPDYMEMLEMYLPKTHEFLLKKVSDAKNNG